MLSDLHATITYTSMLCYEVIVNGYFRMPMDPLDPYAQLVMEAPPSPDYILGPEAPPSPDYIPGPEYPEYLPPADDVFPAEEQPLPAAVSPTVESLGYIIDSEPEMNPEEEDGDDEKSKGDSIDYLTSRGDDDADDDGDDLSEDDADDEDEKESLDSEVEEEVHIASTVPAPALHSSISASENSDQTEPFQEGETAATPPPSAYRVTARIFVRPHIPIPFPLELEIERLLAIPTPPLSPVSPTSYPIPPFFMPLPIFTPLPPPLPIILPRARASMVLMRSKRACFTTPTGGYEVGESSVAATATARQIRPALTVDDSRRADDRLIGRLRRERPLKFNGTERVIVSQEVAYAMPWKTLRQMMIVKYFPRGEIKKLEVELWNLKVKGTYITSYTLRLHELALLCERRFSEESNEIERYVGGLPKMIRGNVMSYEQKSMQKAIEFANEQMDQKLFGIADRQADNKRKFNNTSGNQQNQQTFKRNNNVTRPYAAGRAAYTNNNNNNYNNQRATAAYQGVHTCFECEAQGHFKNNCPKLGNRNHGNKNQGNQNQAGNGNVVAREYRVGTAGGNPDANVVTELDSFDVIICMDWLKTYHAVIVCDEKIVRVPFGNETLIIRCNRSSNETHLNIISCTKTRKYLLKGYFIFLANITTKSIKDKSEEKQVENVPIVRDFFDVFPEDLPANSEEPLYASENRRFIRSALRVEYLLEDRPKVRLSSVESSGRRHYKDYL
nr:hypothetical protein [Tanacetum cinerariifolium]